MLATLVDEAFDDDDWLFEIKWDGYRAICTVHEDGKISLVSRNGLDFLKQFPELEELSGAWKTLPIVIDGEIVSLDERGRSSFQRLQGSFNRQRPSARSPEAKKYPLTYVAFDVLYADGKDLRKTPLEQRKAILQQVIGDSDLVLYSKARDRRRPHLLRAGAAAAARRHHRQTARLALSGAAHARLGEDQSATDARVRDRRFHRTARQPQRVLALFWSVYTTAKSSITSVPSGQVLVRSCWRR